MMSPIQQVIWGVALMVTSALMVFYATKDLLLRSFSNRVLGLYGMTMFTGFCGFTAGLMLMAHGFTGDSI